MKRAEEVLVANMIETFGQMSSALRRAADVVEADPAYAAGRLRWAADVFEGTLNEIRRDPRLVAALTGVPAQVVPFPGVGPAPGVPAKSAPHRYSIEVSEKAPKRKRVTRSRKGVKS